MSVRRAIAIAVVAIPVFAHIGPAQAQITMVEAAQRLLRAKGSCQEVRGNWPGIICVVREPINNPEFVHYHLVFHGLALTRFNEQRLTTQFEIPIIPGTMRSYLLYRRAKRGKSVTLKVQACYRKAISLSSSCSGWALLRVVN